MKTKENPIAGNPKHSTLLLTIIPLGIATNLALNTIVRATGVPMYCDAVGTIIITLLLGWKAGATTGVLSFIISGVFINSVIPLFSGTQIAIALTVHLLAHLKFFENWIKVLFAGLFLGVVAGIVSAPVLVGLNGIDFSGRSFITAALMANGTQILKSVFLSGMAVEPIDKAVQCLLAFSILRYMPSSIFKYFDSSLLIKNKLAGAADKGTTQNDNSLAD